MHQRFQLKLQQWDEINSKIKDVLHLNHILQIELNEKEAAINRMFTELKIQITDLAASHEINKALLTDEHRLQKEVEWYERTYKNRSFLRILTEKLRKKS